MHVVDIMASAGYDIAASCTEIYASNQYNQIGSIGVVAFHTDESQYLKDVGIKVSVVTASKSTKKIVGHSSEPLSNEDESKLIARMDELLG